jgi:hypothetical protein
MAPQLPATPRLSRSHKKKASPTSSRVLPTRKSKAAKLDSYNEAHAIQKKADECLLHLSSAVKNEHLTHQSLEWLQENPKARNLIMLADINLSPAYNE